MTRLNKLEQEVKKWQTKAGQGKAVDKEIREIRGIKVLTKHSDDLDAKSLRILAEQCRDRIGSGIVALGSVHEGRASLIVAVPDRSPDTWCEENPLS